MFNIKKYTKPIPKLSTEQMIEVDRLMIEHYHIELIQMMENAGRCLAILALKRYLKTELPKKKVIVLAGTGGNGGGAMVCARRLFNWGCEVEIYLTASADKMTPIPGHQLKILQQMGLSMQSGDSLSDQDRADLVIDGVIGYSVKGDPYGIPKKMIEWANGQPAPIVSLDTPSGLDLTSGQIHQPTIKADATLTLALPKKGLFMPKAKAHVGTLFLGDISVPSELYSAPGLELQVDKDLFAESDIIQLNGD